MNKITKIVLITAGALCAVGIIICSIAYLIGGAKTFSITVDNGVSTSGSSKTVADTVKLEEFDDFTYDFGDYEFSMVQGDEYKLEYTVYEDRVPEITQTGNKLIINEPHVNGIFWSVGVVNVPNVVILTVPKDDKIYTVNGDTASGMVSFENINIKGNIKISSGDMSISGSKSNEDLAVNMSSGDAELRECDFDRLSIDIKSGGIAVVDCNAKDTDYKASSGSADFTEVTTDSLVCKISSGSFDGRQVITDSFDAELTSGNIEMDIVGAAKDYKLDLSKTTGDIVIDGKDYEKGSYNDAAGKSVKVDISTGDVNINFAK